MDATGKCLALISSALLLWLVPLSVPIPRFMRFCSYIGGISSALAAVKTSELLIESEAFKTKKKILDTELLNTSLALEHSAAESELQLLYFPPPPPLPSEVAPAAASHPPGSQKAQQSTAAVPPAEIDYLDQLIELSKEIGWLDASTVKSRKRSFRNFSPDQIRTWFSELEGKGIGKLEGKGSALKWHGSPPS